VRFQIGNFEDAFLAGTNKMIVVSFFYFTYLFFSSQCQAVTHGFVGDFALAV
jgi:hypothetical protein